MPIHLTGKLSQKSADEIAKKLCRAYQLFIVSLICFGISACIYAIRWW